MLAVIVRVIVEAVVALLAACSSSRASCSCWEVIDARPLAVAGWILEAGGDVECFGCGGAAAKEYDLAAGRVCGHI
jgi:hypothetical protein